MSKIILGVTGGIAAYKACELLRRIQGAGHDVTVVPTAAALEFVGAATWAALSGRPVHTGVFDDAHLVPHVKLGQETDLVVVAPATADLLARAATGRADDLLTNVLLTTRAPVIFAPAMHTEMWLHPATQANVADAARTRCRGRRPGLRPAHRARLGSRTAAGARGAVRGRQLDPGRAQDRRPGREPGPDGPPRRGQRRRHPRASRSGALHREWILGSDGLGPRPRPPDSAAPPSTWSPPTSPIHRRPTSRSSGSAPPPTWPARCGRRQPMPTSW